jgi:diacylglycerol kinase family enzyme
MHVAPSARVDDGLFEIVRFGDLARRDFVISLPRLYRGTHYTHPQVRHSQGAEVFAAPGVGVTQPIEIEADGEIVGALPASFSLLPAALSLLA